MLFSTLSNQNTLDLNTFPQQSKNKNTEAEYLGCLKAAWKALDVCCLRSVACFCRNATHELPIHLCRVSDTNPLRLEVPCNAI